MSWLCISILVLLIDLVLKITGISFNKFFSELGSIFFDLAIGYVVSYIFYYLVVVLKEKSDILKTYPFLIRLNNNLVYNTLGLYFQIMQIYNRKFHMVVLKEKYNIELPEQGDSIVPSHVIQAIIDKEYPYSPSQQRILNMGKFVKVNTLLDTMKFTVGKFINNKDNGIFNFDDIRFSEKEWCDICEYVPYEEDINLLNFSTNKLYSIKEYISYILSLLQRQINVIFAYSKLLPEDYILQLSKMYENELLNSLEWWISRESSTSKLISKGVAQTLYSLYIWLDELKIYSKRLEIEVKKIEIKYNFLK
jgi:hypothetical protein